MALPIISGTPQLDDQIGASIPVPLETGDHLCQKEFHARYEMMRTETKAELIGGIVYIHAALRRSHGRAHSLLMRWLGCYEDATPGVEACDNATTIMSDDSEPQPDACLIIAPDRGGQIQFTDDDYLKGAPELVAEIASSTESFDLHAKKQTYQRAGVKEYLVVVLRQQKIFWFANRNNAFEEMSLEPDGNFHSQVFPGLWLDPRALIALDRIQLLHVLKMGLCDQAHSDFVGRLNSHR